MKLIDILARELKVWPHAGNALGQACDGTLHLDERAEHGGGKSYGWTEEKFTQAEGWNTAWVTRVEWQAAVEALKAEQTEELRPTERAVEWDGSGLPPVGTVCEYQSSLGSWFKVEITAIAKKGICFIPTDRDGENYACKVSSKFRPIRIQEQIAAEEKTRSVAEMLDIVSAPALKGLGVSAQLEALYDAGYGRKKVAL